MSIEFSKLSVLVLAAGMSSRFGSENKLLHRIDGKTVVERSIHPFLKLGLKEVIVVLGHEAERVEAVLQDLPIVVAVNPNYREGMGSSLKRGVRKARELGAETLCVSLADLPYLKKNDVEQVLAAFEDTGGERITLPKVNGCRGHPVCFPKRCFGKLEELRGDEGARQIIRADRLSVVEVVRASVGCIHDLDSI